MGARRSGVKKRRIPEPKPAPPVGARTLPGTHPGDPGSTLMHDPDEPHPWDEEGPPTGQQATLEDALVPSEPGLAGEGSLDLPPSFSEIDSAGMEDLDEEEDDDDADGRRATTIGLLLGVAIGVAIVLL